MKANWEHIKRNKSYYRSCMFFFGSIIKILEANQEEIGEDIFSFSYKYLKEIKKKEKKYFKKLNISKKTNHKK